MMDKHLNKSVISVENQGIKEVQCDMTDKQTSVTDKQASVTNIRTISVFVMPSLKFFFLL